MHPRRVPIIGLAGYAQSGKDTVGGFLVDAGYRRAAFADKVKEFAGVLWPEYGDLSQTEWDALKQLPAARGRLQRAGAAVRDVIGADTWVDALLNGRDPDVALVVTDVRYLNEAEAIRERGGVVWRVHRPGVGPANQHPSETELPELAGYDAVLVNDGTIADLRLQVSMALVETLYGPPF